MGKFEVQILDSYNNMSKMYSDGKAAALYGQYPPLVNVCEEGGKWQSFDIVFRRPRFGKDGAVISPARITVLHNGVLVHDNVAFDGKTVHGKRATYEVHEDKLPLMLQDHRQPVRFRNIWVRNL